MRTRNGPFKLISSLDLVPEDIEGLVRLGQLAVENDKPDKGIEIAMHLLEKNASLEAPVKWLTSSCLPTTSPRKR